MCSFIIDIGKPERRNRKPLSLQCRRPAQGAITRSFPNPAMPGRTALCPAMSLAPAAVPTPALVLAEFGGWDHYSFNLIMSMRA